jgi:cell division protein FtsI/penicillin-binding protein 2
MRTDSRVRIRVLSILFSLIALLLGARLYFVQIVHGASYREDALGQYVQTNPDTDERGTIFFSQKDGALTPAAIMQHGWRVAIVPKDIVDPRGVYAAISAVTPIDAQRFDASVHKTEDPYEEVAFRVPDDAASQIRAEKMPGVLLVQDSWRFYPGKDLAAQTVGFVGYKSDRKIGLYGLERSFQDTLSFTSDGRAVNPFAEIFANINAALSFDPAAHQGSVITTIEPEVERQLEDTLDGVMKTYTPKLAGGIIMDPKTGEIVAMASRPAFDPNAYNLEKDPAVFSNPLVEGRWEMGSIMKPLTMAAGIDTGSVTVVG